MEGLALEFQRWLPLLANKRLISLYFGGGTPALLGPENIHCLIEQLCGMASHIQPDRLEITLEANPDNVTASLMKAYRDAGVNRVSIGVQTLDDSLLQRLGRIHHARAAIEAVHHTIAAGIDNISIDLMYDIPGQTLQSWSHTLAQVASLPITHLSLYNLTIEPHTVFFKYREKLSHELPDADSSAQMYQDAVDSLESYGLERYEISAFAKPGFYSRHNTGYWLGRPFLGFGPSAFSYWDDKRFRNVAHLNRYLGALKDNRDPVDFSEALSAEGRRRELLAIALRLRQGVDLEQFEARHGALDTATHQSLDKLIAGGLLERHKNALKLSDRGTLFYDSVAVEII